MNKEAIGKTPTFSSAFVFVVESVFCEKNIFFLVLNVFF
jgi:hypothetical protein